MKFSYLLILMVVLSPSFLLAEEKAADAYKKMWVHIANSDLEKAYAYIVPFADKRHNELVKMQLKEDLAKAAKGDLRVEVITSKQGKQWAVVIVRYNNQVHTVIMALHDSTWKVLMEEGMPKEGLKNHSREELEELKQWWRDNQDAYSAKKDIK
ncbi:hypothetical protein [Sulfuriroseicoccus oceanibius]|uniref:Uncharacterized protein n=1 Tax=Sulfuriroseicoccus oceanibius TaxID=2707525 RepID=A0A6B3LBB0_9BACT|nr:hypothetical protein [Sulfuriroseicoccus oceanibius]QQL45947.1 hypothetical protein G3M56_005035 [Sulfuriroseicoccus oceanibius]